MNPRSSANPHPPAAMFGLALSAALLMSAASAAAQTHTTPPAAISAGLALEVFATGLRQPVAAVALPRAQAGDPTRFLVVEQTGRIKLIEDGAVSPDVFADFSGKISRGGEQGLLGLALHRDFAKNPKLYVNFTDRDGTTRVVEHVVPVRGPPLDTDAGRELLRVPQPFSNHNGGHVAFGADGKLYVGTGDGGAANDPYGNAQNPDSLLGKLIRIDVDAPKPIVEVIGKGLRNPWRYSFDRKTNDLYIADVGQNRWEWVLAVTADDLTGHDFGWNVTEGTRCFRGRACDRSAITAPVVEYGHRLGCSITGGHVYRGRAIPALDGVYFYADFCSGLLRSFRLVGGRASDLWDWKATLDPGAKLQRISSFAEDTEGELYLISLDGTIYELVKRTAD